MNPGLQGEVEGLEVSATQAPLEGRSSELISKARKEMATLTSEIERVTKQCDAAEQERRVLLAQASACEGAAELAAQVTDAHHIVIPLLLGQPGLLKAQSEMSQKAFTKTSEYLDELWDSMYKHSPQWPPTITLQVGHPMLQAVAPPSEMQSWVAS